MMRTWIEKTPGVINQSNNHPKPLKIRKRNIYQVARKMRLSLFLQGLDVMESHYCRRNSTKMYIAATFRSKAELFNEYQKYCLDNGYDPVVTQLGAMMYLPNGRVMYKIDFDDEYRDLPRKIITYDGAIHEPDQLHSECLKISKTKYNHLQQLKSVIPEKYHGFYDELKYE